MEKITWGVLPFDILFTWEKKFIKFMNEVQIFSSIL